MEDLIGKQLGPYQIVAQLGVGGMATVFKAYQPKMDRYVALKILPRFFSKNPEFVRRFSQEALLIAQLEHLHILPIYDFGESDGYTYLAMRLVKGGSLSKLIEKHRKLELDKINRIITQVGEALDYAHKKNVIHRDTKPGNVLIDEFGNCLLADFGIAKILETTSNLTHTGGILGTPTYVSPEQGSGKPIDSRSDIYSLGVMLYHMIVGDVPYKADTPMAVIYKHIHDPLPLPRKQVPELPESIERVVLKALAKNPDDRYSTAAELVNALQSAIDQFDAQIKKVRESDPDFKTTEVGRAIPANEKELPTKPPVEPKPGIIKPKEIEEKKTLPEPRRLWAYAFLAIILLVMFAGAGWYYYNNIFLSEPILSVESNPSGADVYVNGGHVGVSPVRVEELNPGIHKILISKDRYQNYEEDLFIQKGKPKVIQAELIPKPFGDLEVKSNPSGAEVYIDDDKRGITPIALKNLPKGARKVMVKKEGFDTWLGTVKIVPLEKAHMSADLVTIFGGLNISSNPSEADVYIGGKKKGKTSLILEKVKKGQQKIEIKKNGFDVWRDDVTVKSSEVAKVHVDLRAVIGSPKVKSAPSGAIISLADKKKLELEHQRLEDEKRLLEEKKRLEAEQKRLEQERQELERIKTEIKERKRLEAEKQLLEEKTPPKSSLYVDTDPNDAKVRILNIGQKFYQGIELKSGRYHVEVSTDGHETKKLWITLGSGEHKSIDVRLKKRVVHPSSYSSYSRAREIKRDGRFVAYDNGTLLDNETGFMWAAKDNEIDISYKDAKRFCENYRGGGYTDWRMPTIDQLAGLYETNTTNTKLPSEGCEGGYHINKLFHITCCCHWSSNERGSQVAVFDFDSGNRDWYDQYSSADQYIGLHYGDRYWDAQASPSSARALPVRGGN